MLAAENRRLGAVPEVGHYWVGKNLDRILRSAPASISLSLKSHANRPEVERLIEDVYSRVYGGSIKEHYPILLSACDDAGRVMAAVGLRDADREPLFLERYLNAPIQTVMTSVFGKDIDRRHIVEIGNLVSLHSGVSIHVFGAVAICLKQLGYTHAAVTATSSLHRSLIRLGIAACVVADADAERLADKGANWGTYYECKPKILVASVDAATTAFAPFLSSECSQRALSLEMSFKKFRREVLQ